jgi:hypothetical protein
MPGKPFYSIEEVCQKLSKKPDDVKALVRDGTLREFRDAGKIFFKADDIDKLVAAAKGGSGSGEILLEPADGSDKISMDDGVTGISQGATSSGGTSIIGLEPMGDEEQDKKEGSTVVPAAGIGVFDEDELEVDADPMAKTQITNAPADDQVSLEGAGSGSGLLDLAREADDTALGADLLDEIYPGEEDAAEKKAAPEPKAEEAEPQVAEMPAAIEMPVVQEVYVPMAAAPGDPTEGMFSGLLAGGLILMALACTVVAGAVQGFLPDYGRFLGDGAVFYFFLGGSVLTMVIALLVGWFLGKAFVPRQR